jgi:hypothetical protein
MTTTRLDNTSITPRALTQAWLNQSVELTSDQFDNSSITTSTTSLATTGLNRSLSFTIPKASAINATIAMHANFSYTDMRAYNFNTHAYVHLANHSCANIAFSLNYYNGSMCLFNFYFNTTKVKVVYNVTIYFSQSKNTVHTLYEQIPTAGLYYLNKFVLNYTQLAATNVTFMWRASDDNATWGDWSDNTTVANYSTQYLEYRVTTNVTSAGRYTTATVFGVSLSVSTGEIPTDVMVYVNGDLVAVDATVSWVIGDVDLLNFMICYNDTHNTLPIAEANATYIFNDTLTTLDEIADGVYNVTLNISAWVTGSYEFAFNLNETLYETQAFTVTIIIAEVPLNYALIFLQIVMIAPSSLAMIKGVYGLITTKHPKELAWFGIGLLVFAIGIAL